MGTAISDETLYNELYTDGQVLIVCNRDDSSSKEWRNSRDKA